MWLGIKTTLRGLGQSICRPPPKHRGCVDWGWSGGRAGQPHQPPGPCELLRPDKAAPGKHRST